LLGELNQKKPVWVELGLQTIHERSAEYIRRGYPLSTFDDAMKRLGQIGVHRVVHQILGLPGESAEEMAATSAYIGTSGAEGIKLQLLHVLESTDLAGEYRSGRFQVLSLDEYINVLLRCIEVLPDDIVVHRLTGDGPKRILIAPEWSGDKKRVLNTIEAALKNRPPYKQTCVQNTRP